MRGLSPWAAPRWLSEVLPQSSFWADMGQCLKGGGRHASCIPLKKVLTFLGLRLHLSGEGDVLDPPRANTNSRNSWRLPLPWGLGHLWDASCRVALKGSMRRVWGFPEAVPLRGHLRVCPFPGPERTKLFQDQEMEWDPFPRAQSGLWRLC